ncbi:MAG TPA: sulfatase-like hydrolase/transferase, partial [Gemmatimonadales bacterium]|nr:sulfatase-like hydrolase/transferase [Gemmatimonadales bacterium]
MHFRLSGPAAGTALALVVALPGCRPSTPPPATTAGGVDRTVLPVPEPTRAPSTELDARDATPPPRFEVTAPAGAPNVVIVLIDDIGFGHSSAFGGPIRMPTLDRIAAEGLRYNRFHTTAL